MIVVLTGVSGSGKSTIGQLLAFKLKWSFYEGDDYHPAANIEKMQNGIPLSDEDRIPWLKTLQNEIRGINARNESAVLACSALTKAYRNLLRTVDARLEFVYLKGDYHQIRQRILQRSGHFMPVDLLDSQFAILEEPTRALTVEINQTPDAIVTQIMASFSFRTGA